MNTNFDCIIIGGGPAGVSAALYTLRSNLSTLIVAGAAGSLEKAEKIDNYYGFPGGISGPQLLQRGLEQARALGAEVVEAQVLKLMPGAQQEVHTTEGLFTASAVLLATGTGRKKPSDLPVEEFEGRGVSYCAICDGFFHRGKPVAVLGGGEYAKSEALELTAFAGSVTVLTGGAPPEVDMGELTVRTDAVKGLVEASPGGPLQAVEFEDGSRLELSGLFVAIGTASAGDLARAAGILTNTAGIEVDRDGRTNLPGFFAAGDCVGGLLQVAKAVGDGAHAGLAMAAYARQAKA